MPRSHKNIICLRPFRINILLMNVVAVNFIFFLFCDMNNHSTWTKNQKKGNLFELCIGYCVLVWNLYSPNTWAISSVLCFNMFLSSFSFFFVIAIEIFFCKLKNLFLLYCAASSYRRPAFYFYANTKADAVIIRG